MNERLPEIVIEYLRSAGWDVGRSVSTDKYEASNRASGFVWNTKAAEFLKEFGGLRIAYPNPKAKQIEDSCHFDAENAAGMAIPEAIAEYEHVLGKRLTIIGEAYNENMTLCMDECGSVYGGVEDTLVKFGDSWQDAICCLCAGGEVAEIDLAGGIILPGDPDTELCKDARMSLDMSNVHRTSASPEGEAARFLSTFNGAILNFTNKDATADVCRFGEVNVPDEYLSRCNQRLKSSVRCIGELQQSGGVLLMDNNGRVFLGLKETDDSFWLLGRSGIESINNLVRGIPAERVT